jgi:hypothetical protein
MNRSLTSLGIWEMETTTTMQYHIIRARMSIVRKERGAGSVAQVVGCLLCKHEVLSSNTAP